MGNEIFLDIKVVANDRNTAILHALSTARLFVQLMALVYQKEFEISLVGTQAKRLDPNADPEGSDSLGFQSILTSFEQLIPIWEKITFLQQQNSKLWEVLKLALEWLHFGAIASEDRSIFLAYRIALEILIKGTQGEEKALTMLNKQLDKKKHRIVVRAIRGILSLCIDDDKAIERIIQRIENTMAESDSDRWARILNKAGVPVSSQELDKLQIARGGIVHSGISSSGMSIPRIREIVVAYINALLAGIESNYSPTHTEILK